MAILGAAVIALTALILTPSYAFYFDVTPKLAILLAGCGVALIWAVVSGGISVKPKMTAAFGGLALLTVFSLVTSAALSQNFDLSLFGTSWRRFGVTGQATVLLFAWLAAASCAGRPDRGRTLLWGISAAGVVSAIYGIAQYSGWDPILPASAYRVGEGTWQIVRPPGTMGHAGYFAAWLVMAAFAGLALRKSAITLLAAVPCAACVFLTGSRAGMLGLAAGAAVWLLWTRARISRRGMAIAGLALLAAGAFYYSPAGWRLRSRARWFAEDPRGGARLMLWRDSLHMASLRLPVGYGPETFESAFPRFESAELARTYPDFVHESPHNMFADALVAQGLPGLAALCGFCALGFAAAARLRRSQPRTAAGLAAALAGGIVSQQFAVFTLPTALAFFVIVAVAAGLASEARPIRLRAPAVVAAACVAAALLWAAAHFAAADYDLALTRRAVESGNIRSAVERYRQYGRIRLPGSAADLWYSRALRNLAQRASDPVLRLEALAQSGAAASRATATAEDPFNAWYNLAAFYAADNDAAGAERCLRAAIAAHPNWFKPHWTLARLLEAESRRGEAASEAALALRLNAGKDPEVAATLGAVALRETAPLRSRLSSEPRP